MSVVTQHQPRSILVTMATRYGMEPAAFEATVRATCMPTGNNARQATREEFAAFLLVANEHGLNPLTKEIYAYPKKGGGIQPIVGVDGWIRLINSHPQFDGMEFKDEVDEKGVIFSTTCSIWRKDRSRPVTIPEYLSECYRETEPWKMKRRMLRHKSLIQCARVAFGFAGIMDPDEAEKIIDITPGGSAPPRPQRQDFADRSGPQHRVLGCAGEDAGAFRAARAAAVISGLMNGKPPADVIAVFEHNADVILAIEQEGISVTDLHDIYSAASAQVTTVNEDGSAEDTHDHETGEVKEERNLLVSGDETAQDRPEFWSRESYAIAVPKTDKGADHWPNWDNSMRAAAKDAETVEELRRLDTDNGKNWQSYQVKQPEPAKALRQFFVTRAGELSQ